jgi:hypothetical protein
METIALFKLWLCVAVFGSVLGLVSTLSIQATPSASHAIIAIRFVHLELFWAKIAFRDPAVDEAEFYLNEAWSTLDDQRYEQSIFSARQALQRVRGIKGGVPWLSSSRLDENASEPANSPES